MPKKNTLACASNKIALEPQEKIVVGIDTHKNSYHVALWSPSRELIVGKWVQPAEPDSLLKKFSPLAPHIQGVYYEAGPTGFGLARVLESHKYQVSVIAPSHTPTAPQGAPKCDRLDACRLAEYGAKGLLKRVRIPSLLEERRRQLQRTRQQIVSRQSKIKVQIRSFLLYHAIAEPEGLKNWSKKAVEALRSLKLDEHLRTVLDLDLAELDHQRAQLRKIDEQMDKLAEEPDLAPKVEVLRSVPYFGQTTALVVLTEMPAPERFKSPRQVSAFQGLSPRVERSGETCKEMGLDLGGNRTLRTVLVEAAWRWIAHDTRAALLYKHYLARTGMKQKAIVAVARRLGIIVWQLLVNGTKYDPERLPERA
jgi:transposase